MYRDDAFDHEITMQEFSCFYQQARSKHLPAWALGRSTPNQLADRATE